MLILPQLFIPDTGVTQATTFDRTGIPTYLTSGALTGGAAKSQLVIWCAYRRATENTYLMGNASTGFSLYLDSVASANLVLQLPYSGGGGAYLNISGVHPLNDWCYILISINIGGTSRYIHWGGNMGNEAAGTLAVTSSIDCNPSGWGVGYDPSGGSSHYRGEIAVFGVGFLTALDGTPIAPDCDLTDTATKARFVKPDGTIVIDRGNGSSYTGAQPLIYMQGGASSFVNNRGSGGAFTPTGTFTTYTDPVIIDP